MAAVSMWTDASAGTMAAARLLERAFFAARADIYGSAVVIYWTDDATATGNTLFSTTYQPLVRVMASDSSNAQAWTANGSWGPMLRQEYMTNMRPYCWQTLYDSTNSIWYTEIAQGLPVAVGGTSGGADKQLDGHRPGGQATISKRPIIAYALGKGV